MVLSPLDKRKRSCTLSSPRTSISSRRAYTSFGDCQEFIDCNILQNVDTATDPADLDAVNAVMPAQAEMQSTAVMALIPTTAVDFVDLC